MPPRKRRNKKPDSSTDVPVSSEVVAVLDKVRELREAMNRTPFPAPQDTADATAGGGSRIDVSNDLEKDINIDAPINNNTACSITHNSNITINYYNLESADYDAGVLDGVMKLYGIWLPEPYVAALERLCAAAGTTRGDLAKMAYTPLFQRFGIKVAEPRKTKHGTPGK